MAYASGLIQALIASVYNHTAINLYFDSLAAEAFMPPRHLGLFSTKLLHLQCVQERQKGTLLCR